MRPRLSAVTPETAAKALIRILASSLSVSPEAAASMRRHLPQLVKIAARRKEYGLLEAALQVQAAWGARQSRWQDPLQPTPLEAQLRRARSVLVGLALAGSLALLGVLISGAGDVLKTRLLPFVQPQPLLVIIGLLFLLAALVAGLEALRERWKK